MRQTIKKLFFSLLVFISIGFILAPILNIFLTLTGKALIKTIHDQEIWHAIFTSFLGASLATMLGCVLGVPLAYILSHYEFRGKHILEAITNLPVVIPHVAVGIALLSFFNERTFLGKFFAYFHITFVDTIYGIVIAMAFVSISFVVSSALIGFKGIDKHLEIVSRSLGASAFYTFWHITFPLVLPAIFRGAILAFARGLSEVGALLILAYYPKTAPIIMYERFTEYGLNAAKPIAALVIFFSLLIFFILLYFSRYHAKR